MTQEERSKAARRKWQKLIGEQERSGQSVAAFCRERGFCAPHFFAWKKRLGEGAKGEAGRVEPKPQGVGRGRSGAEFVEVKLASATPALRPVPYGTVLRPGVDGRVEVVLRNGRSLRVGPGFDAELVGALVAVVEGVG
jgi:hypothetical protein